MGDIFELSDRAVEILADASPMLATGLGLPGRNARWDDLSPAGIEAQRALQVRLLDEATACATPDHRSMVAQQVLIDEMRLGIDIIDSGLWRRDLNNIVSPWQGVRGIFELMPKVTRRDWEDVITRLETIAEPLDGYRACLRTGLDLGEAAARRQVLTAIDQGRVAAGDGSSFHQLLEQFTKSEVADDPDLATTLATAVTTAKRAYAAMTDWFESAYLPAAPTADGVGRDAWIASASRFLGRTVDPESTYDWGWAELDRLIESRRTVAAQIDAAASIDEVMERVQTDPTMAAPDAASFIALMQERQETALAQLDGSHFDVPDQIKTIEVRIAPPGGAMAPHYQGPSEDFRRPGRVLYPLDGRITFPLYDEATTAYHEGFPGHHLQVGWQAAMGDELSRFHRLVVWYPGSGEGWALYAEHLMGELGFLDKPEYELGLLSSQIFRSARIVIDIGCHLGLPIPETDLTRSAAFPHAGETWTYELGLEMLAHVCYLESTMAESEIVRYLGWPGQAISYKYGERFILDLRSEMARRPDWDLKQFHADLLSIGAVGLDLLERLISDR
jgi:uncharacterized protein (DUF885 family)